MKEWYDLSPSENAVLVGAIRDLQVRWAQVPKKRQIDLLAIFVRVVMHGIKVEGPRIELAEFLGKAPEVST